MQENSTKQKINELKEEVEKFANEFPLPGFDKT
jgi:hypothetical protein